MINYLGAEPEIINRLKLAVPELQAVYSASDLDAVPENQRQFPAAHVLFHEDRVVTSANGRSCASDMQLVDQAWYVVLAVRNVKTQDTGAAARADAGPLAIKVLKALQGWTPTTEHGPLTRVNGARAGYKAGFLYIPFLFTTRLTI